jgi:hypothetical protein
MFLDSPIRVVVCLAFLSLLVALLSFLPVGVSLGVAVAVIPTELDLSTAIPSAQFRHK